jgi:hypothetical protein
MSAAPEPAANRIAYLLWRRVRVHLLDAIALTADEAMRAHLKQALEGFDELADRELRRSGDESPGAVAGSTRWAATCQVPEDARTALKALRAARGALDELFAEHEDVHRIYAEGSAAVFRAAEAVRSILYHAKKFPRSPRKVAPPAPELPQ